MITLALDTSGPVGSVAVVLEDENGRRSVLDQSEIERGMRHGVELFPALERCLRQAEVAPRDVNVVAVGTGPGSYTGLRVGITAARAFAYAAEAAILGVPSCDAWAAATPVADHPLAVVLDARVRALYVALYAPAPSDEPTHWERVEGPELVEPDDFLARLPEGARVVGDADEPYGELLHGVPSAAGPRCAGAVEVAGLALDRRARGERDPIDSVTPLYLTRPRQGERTGV